MAEESAQYAASAEKICDAAQDLNQLTYVADAAELAAQRAQWAAAAVEAFEPGEDGENITATKATMRLLGQQACERASQSAARCRRRALALMTGEADDSGQMAVFCGKSEEVPRSGRHHVQESCVAQHELLWARLDDGFGLEVSWCRI